MAEENSQDQAEFEQGSNPPAQEAATDTPTADNGVSSESSQEEAPRLSELDEALLKVAELEEQLARRNADMYNLQQEYSGYVRRAKTDSLAQFDLGKTKVLEALIPVLDNAALAREHEELQGPAGKVVEELEATLTTNFKLERFGAIGDPFDPHLHEALMHSTSADVEAEQVQILMQPGYRVGDTVIRPARVGVVSPE